MSAKMLSRPATAITAPTGIAQASTPTPTTVTAWVRLGGAVCNASSEIRGVGPSGAAERRPGLLMVCGAQRPRAQPTAAATAITSGNGVLKIESAPNAATA